MAFEASEHVTKTTCMLPHSHSHWKVLVEVRGSLFGRVCGSYSTWVLLTLSKLDYVWKH